MNELIPINYEDDAPTVSGRELHAALGVTTRYNDWFSRMCEYGFREGKDFYSFLSKTPPSTGGLQPIISLLSQWQRSCVCFSAARPVSVSANIS